MIVGTGIDIVEIERIERLMKQQTRFVSRVLTGAERANMPATERRAAEFVAGRFAAKEALSKALGTGIGAMIQFHDMEISKDSKGKPSIRIAPAAIARFQRDPETLSIHLSISHSKSFAIAQVVLEEL